MDMILVFFLLLPMAMSHPTDDRGSCKYGYHLHQVSFSTINEFSIAIFYGQEVSNYLNTFSLKKRKKRVWT